MSANRGKGPERKADRKKGLLNRILMANEFSFKTKWQGLALWLFTQNYPLQELPIAPFYISSLYLHHTWLHCTHIEQKWIKAGVHVPKRHITDQGTGWKEIHHTTNAGNQKPNHRYKDVHSSKKDVRVRMKKSKHQRGEFTKDLCGFCGR